MTLEVIKNILYFFIGSGILAFLIRSIIKHWLNKDFEKYKLEVLKLAEEHKIKFDRLHSERAEVIKNLYGKLSKSITSMQSLISPVQFDGQKIEDKMNKAVEEANDFIEYYDQNKIFFQKELCVLLDTITLSLKESFKLFKRKDHEPDKSSNEVLDFWDQAWNKISSDVPKAKEKLENEFRKLLGVESD
ncbi:MAG: hypothetical protein HYV33_03195 [Candidatus Kerfeldbacteria bacterium]|nr:hypothetical protein [Candidatus Kerfeldbacteria bacterium]